MIVLGADTHKRSHTIAAVSAVSGELLGEQTVVSGAKGAAGLLKWARGLGDDRVWAIEDCRHVSGSLERFLIERGERVLRVHSTLTASSRREARGRGKSDGIDALAVARAALREGLDTLPAAHLDGPELDLQLLVDHRERLVRARVAVNNTLQWHLHDLWPDLEIPGSSLFYGKWGPRIARRLARAQQTMRVRIARDELRRLRELTHSSKALEAEIADLVAQIAPHLLAEPGFGPLTAAKLVGDRRRGPLQQRRQARPSSRHRPDPGQLGKTPAGTGSTAAATARSTRPSTGSPSPGCAATPRPRTTSRANARKARAPKTRSAASSATSPDASGTCSRPRRASRTRRSHPQPH
jgi:transposase